MLHKENYYNKFSKGRGQDRGEQGGGIMMRKGKYKIPRIYLSNKYQNKKDKGCELGKWEGNYF